MSSVSFTIKLLGSFELYRDGELMPPQQWGVRKTRELLKHLATKCDHIVSDDFLLENLWPGQDVERARRGLWVRVSELRKLLRPARYDDGDGAGGVVQRVAGGYRLRSIPGVLEVDVARFTCAAIEALQADDVELCIQRARHARSVYRGDFLADDVYNDTWEAERERLRDMWRRVSERMAGLLEDQGEYDAAIEVLQSIVSPSDPNEDHYRALMRLEYSAGRQTEALRVFEQCRAALDTLYNVRPMPETIRLMETIVQQRRVIDRTAEFLPQQQLADKRSVERTTGSGDESRIGPRTAHTTESGVESRSGSGVETRVGPRVAPRGASAYPFLGRENEQQRLREGVARLQLGEGAVVWIAGDSGIGKSRLLDEALRFRVTDDAKQRVILMRGHRMAHEVPFSTILDGLQEGGAGPVPADELDELLGWSGGRAGAATSLGAVDPMALQGTWLRQKLIHLLRRFAEERPLILVVDNADDVDGSTWAVLVAISRHVGRIPVLLVVASRRRPEATHFGEALLQAAPAVEHIPLQPLTLGELAALVGAAPLTPQRRRWLSYVYDHSDGDPFTLTELLRWMEQSGFITRQTAGTIAVRVRKMTQGDLSAPPQLPLARNIRDTLDARMALVTNRARTLLVQAAVLGDSISMERLQRLSRLTDDEFARTFEELLSIGFIEEFGRGRAVAIRLSHPRLQNHVYHEATATHRRWLHRQIANLIERELGDVPSDDQLPFRRSNALLAAEAAYHAECAGDFERACRWQLTAADSVATRVGSTQAVDLYRHALALAHKLPVHNPWLRQASHGLGKSLFAAYSFGEAIPHLEQELETSEFVSLATFESASRLALAYMQFHRVDDAKRVAARLLQKAGQLDDPHLKGGILLVTSFLSYRLGEAATAIEQAEAAIRLLRQADARDARLRLARRWLSLYHWDMSEYGLAIKHGQRAVSESREHSDDFELTRSLNQLGELYQDLFCVDSAQQLHEEALRLAVEGDYALLTSEVWRNIGMDFLYKNESHKAFNALERAWQQMLELDVSPNWQEIGLRALLEAYLLSGDVERVEGLLPQYEKVAGPREAPFVAVFRGALALLKGDRGSFEAIFAQTERFWSQTQRRARQHHVLLFMGRTLIEAGVVERGREALTRALALLEDIRAQLPADLAAELTASKMVRDAYATVDSLDDQVNGRRAFTTR